MLALLNRIKAWKLNFTGNITKRSLEIEHAHGNEGQLEEQTD